MRDECLECVRLWRDLGSATANHFRLESKLRFAALQDDYPLFASLTLQAEAAAEVRNALRDAIREHEWLHVADAAAGGAL
jgi:hypothetical protein